MVFSNTLTVVLPSSLSSHLYKICIIVSVDFFHFSLQITYLRGQSIPGDRVVNARGMV